MIVTSPEPQPQAQQQPQPRQLTPEQIVDLTVAEILTKTNKKDLAKELINHIDNIEEPQTVISGINAQELAENIYTTREDVEKTQEVVNRVLIDAIQDPETDLATKLLQEQESASYTQRILKEEKMFQKYIKQTQNLETNILKLW